MRPSDTSTFVEISFPHPEDFLKIKETLTRIGLPGYARKDDPDQTPFLWQSCHILHKRDASRYSRYYLTSFLELYILDGKATTVFCEQDRQRRNTIAHLLQTWGLLTIVTPERAIISGDPVSFRVVKHGDKHLWRLRPKYTIGVNHYDDHKSSRH